MKYTINGQPVTLNRNEVKAAKKVVSEFFKNVDNLAKEKNQPTSYFTFLIVAHIMSQEALDNMDAKSLAMIMNRLNAIKEST